MPQRPIEAWTEPQLRQNIREVEASITMSKTTVDNAVNTIENAVNTIRLEGQRQDGMAAAKQQMEDELARRTADEIRKQAPREELIELYRQRLMQTGAQLVAVTDRERELLQVFRRSADTNQQQLNI